MMYANKSDITTRLSRSSFSCKFWLAHYTSQTDYTGNISMWQYTSKGSVPGISGNVDMNIAYFSYGATADAKHTHNFNEVVKRSEKAATCTTDGSKTLRCSCGETEVQTIAKLGHKFGEWITVTKATEEAEGLMKRTCSTCGAEETKKIDKLDYPLIVKPARLGSSIGIEIVNRKEELESSIEKVMEIDDRILVEEYIENRSEYNMAVIASAKKLIGSMIEEIKKDGVCDYYDKYHKEDNKEDTFKRKYPADISKTLTEEIEKTSKKVYQVLALTGVARIDYIYDNKKKKLYVNEINTVPNFMSHHLFEDKNIDYRELLCIMIKEAIDKIHKRENMVHTHNDEMFKKVTSKDVRNMK